MDTEPDEGLHEYMEEVFENQTRDHLSDWLNESGHFWTDVVSGIHCNIKFANQCDTFKCSMEQHW